MAGGFLKDFTTHYMDPTEVYGRFHELAAEFPNIAELITLPNKTNGYQRKAQAIMAGTSAIGSAPTVFGDAAARHDGRDHGRAAGRHDPVHR